MSRFHFATFLIWLGGFQALCASDQNTLTQAQAFLKANCIACHNEKKQLGDIRLDDLSLDLKKDGERWGLALNQVREGLMPPKKSPQPKVEETREFVALVAQAMGTRPSKLPNQGNLIPHELLFGKPTSEVVPPAGRLWRLSPENYLLFVRGLSRGGVTGLTQPFTLVPERGIKDFAGLYSIDEPSTEILLRNAELIVHAQTLAKNDTVPEFKKLMDPELVPTRPQIESAIQLQHRLAIGKNATDEELKRYYALYEKCCQSASRPEALRTVLQAVLLRTDAMFRMEYAQAGKILPAPELARAIQYALGFKSDSQLFNAASKGELQTKEQVAAHIKRILYDPQIEKTKLLRFFQEYFEYHEASRIFKDKPNNWHYDPRVLEADADRWVKYLIEQDRDVFRELLTSDRYFVNYTLTMNKQTRKEEPKQTVPTPMKRDDKTKTYYTIPSIEENYGINKWSAEQPIRMPENTRMGMLMHPAWLVSWSTNFDNDVVRRGRWIRERLLGGTVPELPIGVAAMVPNEPHRTYRDRLKVTRAEECWKCHRRMDDLGLPFENFDHYGRFRTEEEVLDLEATEKNVDKKNKPLGPVYKKLKLDTSGIITDSGDPKLDGPVKNPRELVEKLAQSDRVRQVFVRHVFRFYMGRNETLADAKTLQEADAAYVNSGGSFKALVLSLLTSDSFLMRAEPSTMESKK
ncbi:MAG: DUF1588 domain-containing protein [Gemmataceae bacterium]|jgi:hypothetical protein|nr:DUF1588 domain-containing protein [Gemmataceae bacterium]